MSRCKLVSPDTFAVRGVYGDAGSSPTSPGTVSDRSSDAVIGGVIDPRF